MKYVSIDIETSGLDPENHDLLEIGAAIDDLEVVRPLDTLDVFQTYIRPPAPRDYYHMTTYPGCTQIQEAIAARGAKAYEEVGGAFTGWLKAHGIEGKINAAGKNFAMFDYQFLKRVPEFPKVRHRILDPALSFVRADDNELPNISVCCSRARIMVHPGKQHGAVYDALLVVQLIRAALGKDPRPDICGEFVPGLGSKCLLSRGHFGDHETGLGA